MTVGALAATITLLVIVPVIVSRYIGLSASPVQIITLSMVGLFGLVLAPVALAVCVAQLAGLDHRLTPWTSLGDLGVGGSAGSAADADARRSVGWIARKLQHHSEQ